MFFILDEFLFFYIPFLSLLKIYPISELEIALQKYKLFWHIGCKILQFVVTYISYNYKLLIFLYNHILNLWIYIVLCVGFGLLFTISS